MIVYPDDGSLYARMAGQLADYIEKQTDVRIPVVMEGTFSQPNQNTTIILLDGTKERRLVGKFGVSVELSSGRTDAYNLKALRYEGQSFVVLAGNAAEGTKYAAYRLMEELSIEGRNASVRPLDIKAEPFIKTRLLAFGNVWGMPVEIQRQCNLEAWPVDRFKPYIDMFDYFGFNAIEVLDRYSDEYVRAAFGVSREEWKNKVWEMCDRAHANGQKVFLCGWGNSVIAVQKGFQPQGANDIVPKTITNFCPDSPADRKRWETEIRDYYVANYSNRIDHFIGHWADAGGCFDPNTTTTIKDPMLLQNELQDAFRRINPKIETSFSLWWLDRKKRRGGKLIPPWRGYESHRSVSGTAVLHKDVAIAQMRRADDLYSEPTSLDILADGHRPAVWAWRMADQESVGDAAMHIRVQRLARYFKHLPESARDLEWHSIEVCQHGMASVVNHYVAGKLMWNPATDVDQAVLEFATKMFGDKNGEKIAEAYKQMEVLRPDVKSASGRSPRNAAANARKCQELLEVLATVKIDPEFRPRLPLIITPQQIYTDLVESLTVINEYYLCHTQEIPALDRAIEARATGEQKKLLDVLNKKRAAWWDRGIAGTYEAKRLEADLEPRMKKISAAVSR